MEKGIRNANVIACKLGLALIRTIYYRLEVAKKEGYKREEMVKMQKAKAMTAKQYRARRKINLSSKEENETNIKDDIDPDKANNKYSLQF